MKISDDMAYPLKWPKDNARTPTHRREESRFATSPGNAEADLMNELRLLGAEYSVVSTNLRRTRRGQLPSDYKRRDEPRDPGVACYFILERDAHVITCDRWDRVEDNVRAIGKTVEAMRGIARWGSSRAVKQAMSGFRAALPAAGHDWRSVLALQGNVTLEDVKRRHRQLARGAHPDRAGNQHDMVRLNQALEAAKQELDR